MGDIVPGTHVKIGYEYDRHQFSVTTVNKAFEASLVVEKQHLVPPGRPIVRSLKMEATMRITNLIFRQWKEDRSPVHAKKRANRSRARVARNSHIQSNFLNAPKDWAEQGAEGFKQRRADAAARAARRYEKSQRRRDKMQETMREERMWQRYRANE